MLLVFYRCSQDREGNNSLYVLLLISSLCAVHVKAGWSNTTRTFDLSVFFHFSIVYQERLLVFDLKRAQRRAFPGRSQAQQCPASTIIVLVLSSANNKVDQKASKQTLPGKKTA